MTRRPRLDHEGAVEAPSSMRPGDTRSVACRIKSGKNCRSKTCTCTDPTCGHPHGPPAP